MEAEKNGNKDRKALYKLINNIVHDKTMEDYKNRLVSNKNTYLKWTSKPIYMSKNI